MAFYLKAKEADIIEKHYDKYLTEAGAKADSMIWHEIVDDGLHIDLVHYLPTKEFPYHVFGTIGMSAYKMPNVVPYRNIELLMFLPEDWQVDSKAIMDEKWYWPIRLLKMVARMPYECDSYLTVGHTISQDEKFTKFADCTDMSCGLVAFPTWLNYDFFTLKYGLLPRKKVNFLCLTAITKDEYNQIDKNGAQSFLEDVLGAGDRDDLMVRNHR